MDGKWFEVKKNQRAPWMVFAEQEYKTHKGINEGTSPLKEGIEKYFDPWSTDKTNWPPILKGNPHK